MEKSLRELYKRGTLILRAEQVRKLVRMDEAIDAVETAFREKGHGRVQMPPKLYIMFDRGDLRAMPAYVGTFGLATVKIVNAHPDNPRKHNLPTVMALIEVVDPDTGYPLAVMDGTVITRYRTGAAAGVSMKYMARKDSKTVGIVGAGAQAQTQAMAAAEVLNLEKICITDLDKEKAVRFKERMEKILAVDIEPKDTIREAVSCADVVITLTPSRKPIVMDEYVPEDVHICGMGADAPGKEEFDPAIFKRPDVKIVLDDWEQGMHSGEVNVPLSKGIISKNDIYGIISEVVTGKKPGRTANETTIFDSTGLAVQDCAVASIVYRKAIKECIGTWINFI